MRILVTGATGFVGQPLCRRLVDAGHELVAVSRNADRAARYLPAGTRIVAWDTRTRLPDGALDRVDGIIHLAGESVAGSRWNDQRKREIAESRAIPTRLLVEAIERRLPHERPSFLVSASAIGVYGDRGDETLTEGSEVGEGYLAEVCQAWEREALRANEYDVRTAIVRVGIVLGQDGGALEPLLPIFRSGTGGPVGSGRQWMSWIHIRDLIEMMVFLAENQSGRGIYNGTAPNPVNNTDFSRALASSLGRPSLFKVPAFALKLVFGEMSSVLLGSQRVLPSAAAALGFSFRFPDVESAMDDLVASTDHELIREQWVPKPRSEVFDFFSQASNLERLTPEFLRFQVLDSSTPEMQEGTKIDYRLNLHGVPMRWQSLISAWRPEEMFVDEQVRGPYGLWHHTHEFVEAHGGTLIRDRVKYRLPLGLLGDVVARSFVERDLERIFEYRREQVHALFG